MIRSLAGLTILVAAGTLHPQTRHEFTEIHMGMAVRLVVYHADPASARSAARAAFDRIAALEDTFSDYRPTSELRRLVEGVPGWRPISHDLCRVLAAALWLAERSGGTFDPTAAPLVALWRDARRTGRLPDRARLDSARALTDWRSIELDTAGHRLRFSRPGVRLDLGGIAKGYILGQALDLLRGQGITSALLEAGGDLVLGDPPPGQRGWIVAIPHLPDQALDNVAVATSGSTEQFVEIDGVRYSHLVDVGTGLGLTSRRQVTVIGPDPMLADALATTLAVLGPVSGEPITREFPQYRVIVQD